MTQTQFNQACAERLIDPAIALENPDLCEALRDRDDEAVVRILNEEF